MLRYAAHICKGIWRGVKERKIQTTIREDFIGHRDYDDEADGLCIYTPWGPVFVHGSFQYNRYTGVWDTDWQEFWAGSALHDNAIANGYRLFDVQGKCVVEGRTRVEICFWDRMLSAVRHIMIDRLRIEDHRGVGPTPRKALIDILTESIWLVKRAIRYVRGVQWFGPD